MDLITKYERLMEATKSLEDGWYKGYHAAVEIILMDLKEFVMTVGV